MEESEKGFTIVDKRHGREDEASSEAPPPASRAAEPDSPAASHERPHQQLPAMDFSTFLISLSTSALYHLGLVAEQEGAEPPPPDLPMARQTIDLLEMLQEKTRGNLTEDEGHLLENMLYELRMQFVEAERTARS